MALPLAKLTGSAYEQGYAHGAMLRAEVRHNLQVYFDRFYHEGGVPRQDVLQRATRYLPAIAAINGDYYDGMRGIAEGAELSLEEVTALNVRYEILYYQYAVKQMTAARDGCTAFALAPHRTANGHLWLGQNWDWIPDVKGALLHSSHPRGMQTLAFTEAGIFGGKIGLNSAGLGLAINGITSTTDDWQRLAKPFHVRCYEILLQKQLDAAVAVVEQGERACSANFLVASLPDRAVDVEAAPHAAYEIGLQDGSLVHTNHFVNPQAIGVAEPPDEKRRFSCYRRERFQAFLEGTHPIQLAQIQSWLQDHQNAPRSICRHENPAAPVDEQHRTVTSIVIDLHDRRLWATEGPPCQSPYAAFDLNA